MSRIRRAFAGLKKKKEKALIVFMTAGDPGLSMNERLIHAFEKEGVDLIELGVPFSDPVADGPVIQASSQRALERGTTLKKILAMAGRARKNGARLPLVLMSYYNPILQHGIRRFAADASAKGIDGLIVPDLPPEEARELKADLRRKGIDLIFLLAPTSTAKRRRLVAKASSGFIYYVSVTGVTGARRELPKEIQSQLKEVKKVSRLPVCVGFGVSTPAQAREVARSSDGVIVGSAMVKQIAAHASASASKLARRLARPFVRALGKKVSHA